MAPLLRWLLPALGITVALYALWVEYKKACEKAGGEKFEALCDIKGVGSCSDVLMSEYGHILSKWGLCPAGTAFDVPNPVLGIIFYLLVALWPLADRRAVLAASTGSLVFSAYLAYILAVELKDFCIVCVSSYVINLAIFAAELREFSAVAAPAAAPAEKKKRAAKKAD